VSIGEQISLLLFMIIASKGAAGVTGAGLVTLAGGLASHRPELIEGVGLLPPAGFPQSVRGLSTSR